MESKKDIILNSLQEKSSPLVEIKAPELDWEKKKDISGFDYVKQQQIHNQKLEEEYVVLKKQIASIIENKILQAIKVSKNLKLRPIIEEIDRVLHYESLVKKRLALPKVNVQFLPHQKLTLSFSYSSYFSMEENLALKPTIEKHVNFPPIEIELIFSNLNLLSIEFDF